MTRIGSVQIQGASVLAPLAGFTDRAFRVLCRAEGAALAVTEMVSARGLAEGNEPTARYLDFEPDESPISVQLFGSEPDEMAEGARVAAERKPDLIDINCGCPVKKIVNRRAGSALLQDLKVLGKMIAEMVRAVQVPITVKIRSGWEDSSRAVEAARVAEGAGAAAIAVHARTRQAGFSGSADLDVIREVKEAVSIPVMGNGDVRCAETAQAMRDQTGCDLVMVGRWAIGNPWIFRDIQAALENKGPAAPVVVKVRIETAIRHLEMSVRAKGAPKGVREMRSHLWSYVRPLEGSDRFRKALLTDDNPAGVEATLRRILTYAGNPESQSGS